MFISKIRNLIVQDIHTLSCHILAECIFLYYQYYAIIYRKDAIFLKDKYSFNVGFFSIFLYKIFFLLYYII